MELIFPNNNNTIGLLYVKHECDIGLVVNLLFALCLATLTRLCGLSSFGFFNMSMLHVAVTKAILTI